MGIAAIVYVSDYARFRGNKVEGGEYKNQCVHLGWMGSSTGCLLGSIRLMGICNWFADVAKLLVWKSMFRAPPPCQLRAFLTGTPAVSLIISGSAAFVSRI